MTDYRAPLGEGAFGGEPARDVRLGNLLRDHVGATPGDDVNWDALASRISSGIRGQSEWWSYAARWDRRAIPIALAAGIVGAMLLFNTHAASASTAVAPDLFAEVVNGTTPDEAVRFYSRAVTSTVVEHLAASAPE